MKSGKGEGDGYRKRKKSMASVICIFLIFVTLASLFYVARERKIITVRERTARSVPAFIRQSRSLRNLGTTPAVDFLSVR